MPVTRPWPILDWKPRHDPRSLNFGIRPLAAKLGRRRAHVLWTPGQILDQGREGACVGFAWTGEALASPVRANLAQTAWHDTGTPDDFARSIYHKAQTLDDWEGEAYEGTSVLAGAKAMQSLGFIRGYRWCFGPEDVRVAVLGFGPVVLGIPWWSGMFNPDHYGELIPGGTVAGGHAILCNGYVPAKRMGDSTPRPMFHLVNSWGTDWGDKGGAWISQANLATLLADSGEACVPVGRSYARA